MSGIFQLWRRPRRIHRRTRFQANPSPSYVQRHILDPLGMSHSTFRQPLPDDLAPLMAKGYRTSDKPPLAVFETIIMAGRGLSATGTDMGRFIPRADERRRARTAFASFPRRARRDDGRQALVPPAGIPRPCVLRNESGRPRRDHLVEPRRGRMRTPSSSPPFISARMKRPMSVPVAERPPAGHDDRFENRQRRLVRCAIAFRHQRREIVR